MQLIEQINRLEFVFKNQSYVIYLLCIMISIGVIKEKGYFDSVFILLHRKIKNKKLLICLVSFFSGILPIPGRVSVSAGMLDIIAPNNQKRSKFGIIDYLATHHYYFWSPLEKTVIIPMAALGLSYPELLVHTGPLLLISLVFMIYYINRKINPEDVVIELSVKQDYSMIALVTKTLPLMSGILMLIIGVPHWLSFLLVAFYYLIYGKVFNLVKINSYINWRLIFFLSLIIVGSNFIKQYSEAVSAFLRDNSELDISTLTGIATISAFGFVASFLLGSSSKYAGLVALLCTIYGVQFFAWFMAVEFCGYILSPFHKCLTIGKMYFRTPTSDYLKVIVTWAILLLSGGALLTF